MRRGPGKHRSWLTSVRFADHASRATLADYLHAHDVLIARRDQVEADLAQLALTVPCAPTVARLRCLRGIDTLTALGLCAEIGEWERFDHPEQLASYLGIVPSEHTTGQQRWLGGITKAGARPRPPAAGRGGLPLPPQPCGRRSARAPPARPRPRDHGGGLTASPDRIQVACGAMADRIERITPAYRGVMIASTPGVVWWGRLHVTGLELLPLEGPLLLVGDHDSYWDTVTAGIAALDRRQIRALAKSSMWKNRLLGAVLTGMGQIPIDRGSGNTGALDRAIEELRNGACIGIYPEGTRSLGRVLRARSGVGYMARAVPEATIIGGACSGTVAIPRFPRSRPHVRVEFFEFDRPAIAPEESPQQYSTRLLAQIRQRAPIEVAGRKRAAALAGRVPTWSPGLAITGKPGGKGALEEALAQTAPKQD